MPRAAKATKRRAGHLARFRFGRLPQPLSPDDVSRLWIEVFIANDLATARELPRMRLTVETLFIHTEPMHRLVQTFGLIKYSSPTLLSLQEERHTPAYFLNHFDELIARFPDIAIASIPFLIDKLKADARWRHLSRTFEVMADVAAGRFDLLNIETHARVSCLDKEASLRAAFIVATQLGRKDVVERILLTNATGLPLTGAIAAGNNTILQLHLNNTSARFVCSRGAIVAALLRGDEDLAERLILREAHANSNHLTELVCAAVPTGTIEFLSRVLNTELLSWSDDLIGDSAAESGRTDVLELIRARRPGI